MPELASERGCWCHAVGGQHRHDDGGQRQLRHHRPGEPAVGARAWRPPYQLTGPDGMTPAQSGCTMANAAALGAFVQATILNTQTGQLYVYDPLVITQGTTPAVAPSVPTLPRALRGHDRLRVQRHGPHPGRRHGERPSAGQLRQRPGGLDVRPGVVLQRDQLLQRGVPARAQGKLKVPSEGTSAKIVASGGRLGTGQACPTVRNFDMVDQDQSDNVTSTYLLNPATGQTAQNTTANAANLPGATALANGSDNILLDAFLDPTLGCTPFTAPDLGNNNQPATSQALDELLAGEEPAGRSRRWSRRTTR